MNNPEKEISFSELAHHIWDAKLHIVLCTLLVSLIFFLYSLSIQDQFEVDAKLIRTASKAEMSSLMSRNSSVFSLLGVQNGASGGKEFFIEEIIQSKDFFRILLDKTNLDLILDDSSINLPSTEKEFQKFLYDESKKSVQISNSQFLALHAEFQESYKYTLDQYISLKIRHKNPIAAKIILELVVDELNLFIKNDETKDAEKAIDYLIQAIDQTQILTIKEGLNALIESNLKTIVLSNIKDDYAIEYLDSPFISTSPNYPNRRIFIFVGLVLGAFVSILITLLRIYIFKR